MRRQHPVKIWVSKEEKETILFKSRSLGFATVSAYIRWCLIVDSKICEELQEIKCLLSKNG